MAVFEAKREWSPEQLGYVRTFLLHSEKDVKDLPECCIGSKATVSETDNEYVCTVDGWKLKSECKEMLPGGVDTEARAQIAALTEEKLDKNFGVENAGRELIVGSDGNVTVLVEDAGGEQLTVVAPVRIYEKGYCYVVESTGKMFVSGNDYMNTAAYQVYAGKKYRFKGKTNNDGRYTYVIGPTLYDRPTSGFSDGVVYTIAKNEEVSSVPYDYEIIPDSDGYLYVQYGLASSGIDPAQNLVEVTGGATTETEQVYVEFDTIEPDKVYTKSFPTGATVKGYTTYTKSVQPGETYYITSMPVLNDGYGMAHFFNGSTFIGLTGAYPDIGSTRVDYKVTVPSGANLMRIIPGHDSGEESAVPIVWYWSNGEPAVETPDKSNFVSFDGTNCIVKAKYNDTEDVVFVINDGGGNNLPDLRRIYTVANDAALNEDVSESRTLLSSGTDLVSPHVVKAVDNADGDNPENAYFTGGNHQTNNQGSGGAVTARSEGLSVKCDNVTVGGSAWGNVVTVSWTNYIQGYNTSKATGDGREVMREDVTLTISGTRIAVDVKHYALENIVRSTYYGLQMVLSAFDSLRYIGGANRSANACDVKTDSGNKTCRIISLETDEGDVLEIGIDNVDLGDFSQDGVSYSAFTETYGKSYFAVIMSKDFAQNTGEMTTLRGYYHITSK